MVHGRLPQPPVNLTALPSVRSITRRRLYIPEGAGRGSRGGWARFWGVSGPDLGMPGGGAGVQVGRPAGRATGGPALLPAQQDQAGSRLRRQSGDSNPASRLARGRGRAVPAGRGRLCPARPRVPAVLLDADRHGRLPGWRHRGAEPAGDALRAGARGGEAAVHLHAVRRAPVRCGEAARRSRPGRPGWRWPHDRAAAGGGVPVPGTRQAASRPGQGGGPAFAIAAVGLWPRTWSR